MKLVTITEVKSSTGLNQKKNSGKGLYIGFEIECFVNLSNSKFFDKQPITLNDEDTVTLDKQRLLQREFYFTLLNFSELKQYIDKVVDDGSLDISGDGAINQSYIPVEIITKPIPYEECLTYLDTLFNILVTNFDMHTNSTCSLHVNISNGKTKQQDIDLLKLALFLGESYYLQMFARGDNEYAKSVFNILEMIREKDLRQPTKEVFDTIKRTSSVLLPSLYKYFSFNPQKLKQGYLEFRIIGGLNYHKRIKDIHQSINHFARCVDIATTNDYVKEYVTKLTKFVNKLQEKPTYNSINEVHDPLMKETLQYILQYKPSLLPFVYNDRDSTIAFIISHFDNNVLKQIPIYRIKHIKSYISKIKQEYDENNNQLSNNDDITTMIAIFNKLYAAIPQKKPEWSDSRYLYVFFKRFLNMLTHAVNLSNITTVISQLSRRDVNKLYGIYLDIHGELTSNARKTFFKFYHLYNKMQNTLDIKNNE